MVAVQSFMDGTQLIDTTAADSKSNSNGPVAILCGHACHLTVKRCNTGSQLPSSQSVRLCSQHVERIVKRNQRSLARGRVS